MYVYENKGSTPGLGWVFRAENREERDMLRMLAEALRFKYGHTGDFNAMYADVPEEADAMNKAGERRIGVEDKSDSDGLA